MYYLSSCSIVKDEDDYIDEFVNIHKKLGVEFFLFFDRSKNPLSNRYKGRSDIKVINFPEPNRHAHAWREGVKYFKGKSKWVQFIDIDQVTVPVKHSNIKEMLSTYEDCQSLGLNWHTFGGNGLLHEPKDISTYEAYTKRAKGNNNINKHIQSIVQVDYAVADTWHDPHHPIMKPGYSQFNENKVKFTGPFNNDISTNVGFIAHYYTRSKEYWIKKCDKLRADTGTEGVKYHNWDEYQNSLNEIEDFSVKNIWLKAYAAQQ